MTDVVVSQVAGEVIRTNTDPLAQVYQVAGEVIRTNTSVQTVVYCVAVEILSSSTPGITGGLQINVGF